MGMFDFMAAGDIGAGFSGVQNAQRPAKGFLDDPNLLAFMANLGAQISPEGTAGKGIGNAAGGMIRAIQFQKAAAKKEAEDKQFRSDLMKMLGGGSDTQGLVGPKEDLNSIDSITHDAKGTTIKLPASKKASAIPDSTVPPMENTPAQKEVTPPASTPGLPSATNGYDAGNFSSLLRSLLD